MCIHNQNRFVFWRCSACKVDIYITFPQRQYDVLLLKSLCQKHMCYCLTYSISLHLPLCRLTELDFLSSTYHPLSFAFFMFSFPSLLFLFFSWFFYTAQNLQYQTVDKSYTSLWKAAKQHIDDLHWMHCNQCTHAHKEHNPL